LLWGNIPRTGMISDEGEYLSAASWLAHGYGFDWYQGYLWTRAPLYPLFLAAHLRLFGDRLAPIYGTQMLLSLLNVALVYFLAHHLTADRQGDRRQETGDRRQETGGRRQETGDRRQEAAPPSAFRFLPSAFCLPLSAFRFLPSAFCLPLSAFCLLPSRFCLLASDFSSIALQIYRFPLTSAEC